MMRVGFLGTGTMSLEHARAVEALGHLVHAGTAQSQDSPRWKRFKTLHPGAQYIPNGEALLDCAELDAIVTCLPWDQTSKWLPRIVCSKRPVLIEKPAALTSKDLQFIAEKAYPELSNKIVGFNRRFYEPVQQVLKRRLEQGGLKSVEAIWSENLDQHERKYGEAIIPHVLAFSTSHFLDLLHYLLGDLKLVTKYLREERGYEASFSSIHALLERKKDRSPVWLSVNAMDPTPSGIRMRFDDFTTWHLAPLECLRVYEGVKLTIANRETNIRIYTPQLKSETLANADLKPGILSQMKAFLAGDRTQSAGLHDSLGLVMLIESLMLGKGRG